MILEQFPDLQSLTRQDKEVLTQELLDDLNAPDLDAGQDAAILDLLTSRYERYCAAQEGQTASWSEARDRLQEKTGASWQK